MDKNHGSQKSHGNKRDRARCIRFAGEKEETFDRTEADLSFT